MPLILLATVIFIVILVAGFWKTILVLIVAIILAPLYILFSIAAILGFLFALCFVWACIADSNEQKNKRKKLPEENVDA